MCSSDLIVAAVTLGHGNVSHRRQFSVTPSITPGQREAGQQRVPRGEEVLRHVNAEGGIVGAKEGLWQRRILYISARWNNDVFATRQ